MGIGKVDVRGNSFIGAFGLATDSFSLVGNSMSVKHVDMIKEMLGIDTARISIDGSDLIGIYAVANSGAVLLPEISTETELKNAKELLPNVRVEAFRTDLNALGNNILANDKIAFVNSAYSGDEERRIGDALGVETIRLDIGGLPTVGASNILTNKGMVLNNRAEDHDIETVGKLISSYSQSTANLGSLSLRLSTISNSNGLLVGAETTGFEMARIAEGLGL
jgi:translation initiation factor 6